MIRHFYFPRPYPDELIGSLILRACHHRGLPLKTLSGLLVGSPRSYWTFGISGHLEVIATITGVSALDLLWHHTIFPYVTAFMNEAETSRLAQSFMGNQSRGNGALAKAATQGNLGQRYCDECLQEDLELFGEAYWHREHNLPFVLICWKHGTSLKAFVSDEDLVANRSNCIRRLPEIGLASVSKHSIPDELAQAINRITRKIIARRVRQTPKEWHQTYRAKASARGLAKKGKGLASMQFAKAFRDSLGQDFLGLADLNFQIGSLAWPALMLREEQQIPFATSKHVLLQTFLEMGDSPNGEFGYNQPGKRTRDYNAMDIEYEQLLRKAIRDIKVKDTRAEVTKLLTDLCIWHVYRHNRLRFPKTTAVLAEFKKTEYSARQIGRRPRKYK